MMHLQYSHLFANHPVGYAVRPHDNLADSEIVMLWHYPSRPWE